jgi:branched-subunit amino acid ABC-type transport system permease component
MPAPGSTHGPYSASTELDQLLQHIVNALMLGGTYALLGIGLTLIFGIMRVVNFTHASCTRSAAT